MKKVIAIVAIATVFAACGSNNTVAVNADSTAAAVDTNAVSATDSTVAQIPAADSVAK
jgi:hypothetical protein